MPHAVDPANEDMIVSIRTQLRRRGRAPSSSLALHPGIEATMSRVGRIRWPGAGAFGSRPSVSVRNRAELRRSYLLFRPKPIFLASRERAAV